MSDQNKPQESTEMVVETPTHALRPDAKPINVGLLIAENPAQMIQVAESIATPLAELIKKKELFVRLGNNDHVRVEGWTTMLAMLGITPIEKSCQRIECELINPDNSETIKSTYFEVYIELRAVADGHVVGGASAECGGPDEMDWHFRPKYEYHFAACPSIGGSRCTCSPDFSKDKKKVRVGYERVQPNARRSMAGTRATSKAARLAFSWIIELAGFKATPAEEMTGSFEQPAAQQGTQRSQQPQQQAQQPKQQQAQPQQARPQSAGQGSSPRKMPAKFASKGPCPMCGVYIDKGEEIAYTPGEPVLHWTCFTTGGNQQQEQPRTQEVKPADDDLPF